MPVITSGHFHNWHCLQCIML